MEIVQKPSFQVIGLKITCSGDQLGAEMPKVWKRFVTRADDIPNRLGESMVDICLSKVGDTVIQLVGAPVSDLSDVPDEMEGVTIPAQSYVRERHNGPEEDIYQTFGKMIEWAEASGLQLDPLDFKIDIAPADPSKGHDLYIKVV